MIGKISFNAKDVIGRGCEGTFVYKCVWFTLLFVFKGEVYTEKISGEHFKVCVTVQQMDLSLL